MNKEIQVLFLDDEADILKNVERLFDQEPYKVYTTQSVEKAREILQKEKIKVVVTDQRMKEIQGVQFLQEIKLIYPNIVRVLFAASTDFSSAEEAINMGEVYRFISKPWKDTELLSTIRRAIEHYDLIVRADLSNQRLKAMYELQREFTSTVSHELRTPLASIKTAIDMVYKRMLGEINREQEEVLGRAKKNVDRLKRLIDDILDLTKMESGKLQMNFTINDINRMIKDVAEMQKNVATSRKLYLRTVLDPDVPRIPLDSDRITQVLNNLIGNALKFTKYGGITIKTTLENGIVTVRVMDTGKGISETDLPKLFQKFQQIESAEENEEGGTGLGLAISKEIISKHGGDIWVESKLNEGTSFNFTLPVEQKAAS